jgi:cytochrome c oxidase subunit 3/cytochrome o ubiquinol oxidase subunit 3
VQFAEQTAQSRQTRSLMFLFLTIVLGIAFLVITGFEWHALITESGLTISRNLFGTTYFTLVGFHAAHVAVGIVAMTILFALAIVGRLGEKSSAATQLTSWYWHFVDAVWICVFTLVYIVGR